MVAALKEGIRQEPPLPVSLGFQPASRLSAPSFLCPNLVALLLVPTEKGGGLRSFAGGGEEGKGHEKALTVGSHITRLPGSPGFSSACPPLGHWPLCPHYLDQRVAAVPDD